MEKVSVHISIGSFTIDKDDGFTVDMTKNSLTCIHFILLTQPQYKPDNITGELPKAYKAEEVTEYVKEHGEQNGEKIKDVIAKMQIPHIDLELHPNFSTSYGYYITLVNVIILSYLLYHRDRTLIQTETLGKCLEIDNLNRKSKRAYLSLNFILYTFIIPTSSHILLSIVYMTKC